MNKSCLFLLTTSLYLLASFATHAQKPPTKKYPSLFWEITGNGLRQPSFLFGTMHVSNKLAFNLSDSFYHAINSVDLVALELNPDLWQGQMVQLDRHKRNYANFTQPPGGEYLNEHSFRISSYTGALKAALNTEPTAVNSFLYRTYKIKDDFEEDTFLDMYIYQTGKKLGKRTAGVEDYNETEKVVLEAYADMAMEKKKRNTDVDNEAMRNIGQKIQDAYRSGDLDLLDSLENLTERSDAFREKFLYKRNEIQAASIDTILKRSRLFVGVGAAHLPGPRGIIEILRSMGYRLRPIKMTGRDALNKEATDKLTVPVTFNTVTADDGFFTLKMPGQLFKIKDEELQQLNRYQYSDMSNGSYYLVTRIKTGAAFLGETVTATLANIDSLLYENIPGKIISKKNIIKNGYPGRDIVNRTRRGDLQRYQIMVTPFDILVFKMSGKENYVAGKEASIFFSSITLRESKPAPVKFIPAQGGFTVALPHVPHQQLNEGISDGLLRWEYEATDATTGDAYLLFKKSVYNFKFLEEDSFDLHLIETSFRSAPGFERQINRKLHSLNGYPCLDVKEQLRNGRFVLARYIIRGPHYYCVAVSTSAADKTFQDFFSSFQFSEHSYPPNRQFVDTFLRFSVTTPVTPDLDDAYREKLEQLAAQIESGDYAESSNSYWPKSKNALFRSDSTGETVGVSIQRYPKYYTVKDSANFWTSEMFDYFDKNDLVVSSKTPLKLPGGETGYRFTLRDTGSSRVITRIIFLKEDELFSLVTLGDSISQPGNFVRAFLASFAPGHKNEKNIFRNNLSKFFSDLQSSDSAQYAAARKSISNIYFGEKGVGSIANAITQLRHDRYYVSNKTKLIAELGYIKDTGKTVVPLLKKLYDQAADTSLFQDEVVKALARHRSSEAIRLFRDIVIKDPPVFTNTYEYTAIFNNLQDSLQLAASLYPELLQLLGVDDYKSHVRALLVQLVDSGFIQKQHYLPYFDRLLFDAKIELKKQQGSDERLNTRADKELDDDDDEDSYPGAVTNEALESYSVLLMPFYETGNEVPAFFQKMLRSANEKVRLNAALQLLRYNKRVPDSIILWFASQDRWRSELFTRLEKMQQLQYFPTAQKQPELLARSFLVAANQDENIDSLVYAGKEVTNHRSSKGWVYFFKYRIKKGDEWKMGFSGLQPLDDLTVSSKNTFVYLTDKRIKYHLPEKDQFSQQLERLLFSFRKSARNFFEEEESYEYRIGDGFGE